MLAIIDYVLCLKPYSEQLSKVLETVAFVGLLHHGWIAGKCRSELLNF